MARILLYTDQPIQAIGLRAALQERGHELLVCESVEQLAADIELGVADLVMVDLTRAMTFRELCNLQRFTVRTPILLWVETIETALAFQVMGVGFRGILRKDLPAETQLRGIDQALAGELCFEKALTDLFLRARRVRVTRKESQVISLVSKGLKNKEIATELDITEGTVKVYLSRIFDKTRTKDRWELAIHGQKNMGVPMDASHAPRTLVFADEP